ncbi:hypothetical protein [Anatilimnocola floriformis]|uniref:hypothetical protein n=1 Tax=Anatilimnocola floriformis TaxID=2948575 RepID=UPI0020C36DC6|nr:hypothetical protein [Anatilimnocola floriformis]
MSGQIINAATRLAEDIDDTQTTITVDSIPGPPRGRLRIGSEFLLCTNRSGDTLTVIRGAEGTSAASHVGGTRVYEIKPPTLYQLIAADGFSAITAADFSWINQGGATLTDHNGTVCLRAPRSSSTNWRIAYVSAPTPPYSVIAGFRLLAVRDLEGNAGNPVAGLILRQSSSGKFHDLSFNTNSTTPFRFLANDWTDETTFSGTSRIVVTNPVYSQTVHWLRVRDDGANLTYSISPDGVEWVQLLQHSRTALGAPDQIGIGISNYQAGSGNFDSLLRLLHWHVE